MRRVLLDGVMKYTCVNTEQLGILVEKAMCDVVKIPFNTKRKYKDLPCEIKSDISDTIGPVLKKMKLKHVGNLNMIHDFVDDKDMSTLSVKTIMKGNKICPQNIGQCSLSRLSSKLERKFSTKDSFKMFFIDNKISMLQHYLENCFCCDMTMVYKFDKGCIYVIKRNTNEPLRLDLPKSEEEVIISTSKKLYEWNESNTVYFTDVDMSVIKKMSLGEVQIHNNRDCVKFRFNVDTLLSMIDKGYINLSYDVYNLKTKYNFTVEKRNGDNMVKLFPSFNYIGSKMKLLEFIKTSIMEYTCKESYNDISGFADICSGTGIVSFDVLRGGCNKVLTNDIQHYAYMVSSVWCNTDVDIKKISELIRDMNAKIIDIKEQDLENVDIDKHFVYKNYTPAGADNRLYLTKLNGYKTDILRQSIESVYEDKLINEKEYKLLLKLLLYAVSSVSNIASVYGAYLKTYKKVALKDLVLNVSLLNSLVDVKNDENRLIEHRGYNMGIVDLLRHNNLSEYEVVYMDPPYVANRSYHDNYHVLESISRYDNPKLKGKTGLRDIVDTKSRFCSKREALDEFKDVLSKIRSRYMFISYSSESIVSKDNMIRLMEETGWLDVKCYEKSYQRFKSNKNNEDKQPKEVMEYIFCGKRN